MSKAAEQKKNRREQLKNAGARYRAKKAAEGKVRVSLWVDADIALHIKKIIKSEKTKNAEICGLNFCSQDIYIRFKYEEKKSYWASSIFGKKKINDSEREGWIDL